MNDPTDTGKPQNDKALADHFPGLTLTQDQQDMLERFEEFIHSGQRVFILRGYAGTGKTTLLRGIIKYLESRERLGHVMAPTGRAAKVIKDLTGYEATTIHKAIYDLSHLETYQPEDGLENETFKFFFGLNLAPNTIDKVYIFDEASMIGDHYTEGEFFRFGSGYLLRDILEHYAPDQHNGRRLLFIGDPAQLPPVGSTRSPALLEKTYEDAGLPTASFEMKEVVRQKENSGILKNATYYRELIFNSGKKARENDLDTSYDDIHITDIKHLQEEFVRLAPEPDVSKCVIVAYTNHSTASYNQLIREHYFPERMTIQAGDILQVIRNNYRIGAVEFLNGEFIKVLSIDENVERQEAPIKVKGSKDKIITLTFRNIIVLHPSGETVRVKILESLLNSRHRDLSSDETKALYINFIIRYEKETGRKANRNSEAFKESLKKDPYFNALQVKYGYAITAHKAQGGEWEHVFVDFDGRAALHEEALRWCYTAITRARRELWVLDPPRIRQTDIPDKDIRIKRINRMPAEVMHYPDPGPTPYHSNKSHPAKKLKYLEAEKKMEEMGYRITNVVSKDYQEKYTIETGQRSYTIDMYHRKDGIFNYYRPVPQDETSNAIIAKLKEEEVWPEDVRYTGNDLLTHRLYQMIKSAKEGLRINIIHVDDSKKDHYQIIFYLRTPAGGGYLQFFFRSNEKISNVMAFSLGGEKDDELKKLTEQLKKL